MAANDALLERVALLEARLAAAEENIGTASEVVANPLQADSLSSDVGPVQPSLRGVVELMEGRLTDAPPNLHQATVVMYLDPKAETKTRVFYMLGSFAIIFLQLFGVHAVLSGADKPACVTNVDCSPGQYCATRVQSGGAGDGQAISSRVTKACVMCLCEPPMWDEGWPVQAKCGWISSGADATYTVVDPTPRALFTNVSALEFCGNKTKHGANPNFVAGCDACYSPAAQVWSGRSKIDGLKDAVNKMRGGDWIALIGCLTIYGVYIGQEFVDIQLCGIISRQREKSSWPLSSLNTIRMGFVLWMGAGWQKLVLHRGSDALTVAFNLVAMLFFLEMDNIVYAHILSPSDRAKMQMVGRPEIGKEEQTMLLRTKWLFMLCIPMSAPLSLFWAVANGDDFPGVFVSWGIVCIVIAAEHVTRFQFDAPAPKMLLEGTAKAICSLAVLFVTIWIGAATGLVSI
jgi:hypothetical protein